MRIKISFAGSFQCRLATDPDDTDASPNEPAPPHSLPKTLGLGRTFAYYEPPPVGSKKSLDRIIRLSNPHLLRTALVDPWQDTKVTLVEASRSLARWDPRVPTDLSSASDDILLVPVLADPLMGQVVSLGEAKFASLTPGGGGGDGYEVLNDFTFSIGGMLCTAKQAVKTQMTGMYNIDKNEKGEDVQTEWKTKKTAAVKAVLEGMKIAQPARARLLSEYYEDEPEAQGGIPRHIKNETSFFIMAANLPDMPLNQVQIRAATGVLSLTRNANLAYKLSLTFSRFDSDTLTGQIKGVLEASDSGK
jgi:hypothetical protein